ncbi:hypothetical protein pCPXV0263 [Cowpox virus]|uniref:Uncharacterized protein n=1 Tax=Cowpox virus TaxID=10243 RepID=A0A212Q318_COWPX|nr:hypothetical protein pCPXV0263 [Cowpox virus]SNB53755.1 hypothetical protein pCPXV0263 [Cowpox virus]
MFTLYFYINGTNFILALCIVFVSAIKLHIQIIMRCVYANGINKRITPFSHNGNPKFFKVYFNERSCIIVRI